MSNIYRKLDIGRKINIPGPVAFAPWPGQMVRIMQGHHLRSNQYLIVRVYDETAARANWAKAVIKPQNGISKEISEKGSDTPVSTPEGAEVKPDVEVPDLTLGKPLVIKGTDVSFYIPPTGIEVVPDRKGKLGEILVKAGVISQEQLKKGLQLQKENNKLFGRILIEKGWATEQEVYRGVTKVLHYVRDAITLERLEYCILLNEDGNKRYIKGPAVVFPNPTEIFLEKEGSRKFKAIELNEISGLYIKVIAPYQEDGRQYNTGDELFITGKEQMIYFPRPEHAIIRYGNREVHYAVAIPAGEARYVLNRLSGQIILKKGPCMLLPDPCKEVIIRRVLEPKLVRIWFPDNQEALEYNHRLIGMRIYDVEVLDVSIEDATIAKLLIQSQHSAVQQTLELAAEQRNLEFTQQQETIKQQIAQAQAKTQQLAIDLEKEDVYKHLSLNLATIESDVEAQNKQLEAKLAKQEPLDKINDAELARQKVKTDMELAVAQQQLAQRIERLNADVEAVVNKANAVSPQLVAALQAFSDKALAEQMAESMAPLAILGGKSITDVFAQLLKGTGLEHVLGKNHQENGNSDSGE